MRKKRITKDPLHGYPETMSMEQLRIVCQVSKRTAVHLLENGLIPSVNSGKKTRKYRIAKKDVAEFLERKAEKPSLYAAPKGWYAGANGKERKKPQPKDDFDGIKARFLQILAFYPDVMSVQEVARFTGYEKSTVVVWCRNNKLRYFDMGNRFEIPKPFLLDFMMGPGFWGMCTKKKRCISHR
jgi:excisionase family DNA binding protein